MSCRRAFEVDLAAFLLDPRAAEWDDFRAHYPTCRECAAEIAAWTTLGTLLAPDHPSPEALLEWVDEPGSLPAARRSAMRAHLARCRTCADEVRALGRFEKAWAATREPRPEAERRPAREPSPDTGERRAHAVGSGATRGVDAGRDAAGRGVDGLRGAGIPGSRGAAERSALRRWSRVLWNPALPYAALLTLLLLPAVRARLGADRSAVVENSAAPAASAPSPASVQVLAARPADADRPPVRELSGVRALDAPSSASLQKDALRPADAGGAPVGGGSVAPAQKAPSAAPAARPAQPPAAEMVATTRALPREAADAAAGAAGELAVAAPGAPARSLSAPGVPSDDDPRTMILSALTPAGTRKLSIPLPVRARNEGAIEVRVRDASGDRELREAIRTAPDSTEITIDVPAAWLRAGRYEVELHSASGLLSRTGLTAR